MKYTISIILLIFTISCDRESAEERFKRLCPYELTLGSTHLLKIPFTVNPNQLEYKVGDTITVSSSFSKDIYDLNTKQSFTIDSILLRPVIGIFRFYGEDKWERTNDQNFIQFDPIYTHVFGSSTFALFNNNPEEYALEFKILLKKPGRYVMLIGDQYSNNEESHIEMEESIYPQPHPELCPNISKDICNVIDGETHMKALEPEFIFIDKEIAFDNYYSISDKNSTGVFNSGSFAWEYNGAYGFVVEE